MTSIYFPVRTNVHYWDLDRLELNLEARLKLSAILYDDLIFDDGGYAALVGPNVSLDIRVSHLDQVPDGFFENHSPPSGGEFSVGFGDLTWNSPAQRRYQLCFRQVLEDIGLIDEPWIIFSDLAFTDKANKEIEQLAKRDLTALHDGDFNTFNLHWRILRSLNYDWMMGTLNEWDLNMDPVHETYLRQKLSLLAEEVDILNPPVDFEVVFPRLPDLTRVSWDQVLKARGHPSAAEFRQRLGSVSQEVQKAYLAGEDADAIRYHIMTWRDDQLIEELSDRLVTTSTAVREIVISLLFVVGSVFPPIGPFIGAIDSCRSVIEPLMERAKDRKSMAAAFVRRQQNGSA